jgi:hypothetical protein
LYFDNGGNVRDAPSNLRHQRLRNFGGSVTYGSKDITDYAAVEDGLLDGERVAAECVAAGGSGTDVAPKVEVPHIHIYNSPLKRFWMNVVGFTSQLVGGIGKVVAFFHTCAMWPIHSAHLILCNVLMLIVPALFFLSLVLLSLDPKSLRSIHVL